MAFFDKPITVTPEHSILEIDNIKNRETLLYLTLVFYGCYVMADFSQWKPIPLRESPSEREMDHFKWLNISAFLLNYIESNKICLILMQVWIWTENILKLTRGHFAPKHSSLIFLFFYSLIYFSQSLNIREKWECWGISWWLLRWTRYFWFNFITLTVW